MIIINNKNIFTVVSLVGLTFIYSCQREKLIDSYSSTEPYKIEIGNFPPPNIKPDNPLTKAGVQLGRILFYEKALSKNNTQACASCHLQEFAFTDTSQFSVGVQGLRGKRQAMSIFNTAWHGNGFFWDGRANQLRDQALMPIEDHLEMNETLNNVVKKLSAKSNYLYHFNKVFGSNEITSLRISLALEQFMYSIVSNQSKYDQYLAGKTTLTAVEERGRFLFFTEYNPGFPAASGADCQHCHSGANFANNKYMNNGLDNDASMKDSGRALVTKMANDMGKFKVTSLRNIELTAPYMHDGRFTTLEEVVDHYNLVKTSSTLDASFQQQLPNGLQLSASDKAALVAFLKTLTDPTLAKDTRYSSPF